jgi:hypothetical protein
MCFAPYVLCTLYTIPMRALGLATYLALVIERFSQTLQGIPTPLPALVRRVEGDREALCLEQPYYPAQGLHGYVLIPKDRYFNETERVLTRNGSR